jgi:hypothetical protein
MAQLAMDGKSHSTCGYGSGFGRGIGACRMRGIRAGESGDVAVEAFEVEPDVIDLIVRCDFRRCTWVLLEIGQSRSDANWV